MSEISFDTRDGSMLVGEAAVAARMADSMPGDIMPLSHMLESEAVIDPHEYPKQQKWYWTEADYVALGAVTYQVLREANPDADTTVLSRHLKRLYFLGIGPKPHSFIGEGLAFSSIDEFRDQCGAPPPPDPSAKFDAWTMKDHVAHARKVEQWVGGKPKPEDYQRYAKEHPGSPTITRIRGLKGGVSMLNEHLGYPNIKTWSDDDAIDFGVRFVEANGPDMLHSTAFTVLAAKKRGPSREFIHAKFGDEGGWDSYRERVLAAHKEAQETKAAERARKLGSYRKMIQDGALPEEYVSLPEDELLVRGGRAVLVDTLLEDVPVSENWRRRLIEMEERFFVRSMLRMGRDIMLDAGTIELEASIRGIYDDLWPMDDYDEYLRVDQADLDELRAKTTEKMREYRERKNGMASVQGASAMALEEGAGDATMGGMSNGSVEALQQAVIEVRDHVGGTPAAAAAEQWEQLPVGQIGEAIGALMRRLAALKDETEAAGRLSEATKDGCDGGAEKLSAAVAGTGNTLAEQAAGMLGLAGIAAEKTVTAGGRLGVVYGRMADQLQVLSMLADEAAEAHGVAIQAAQETAGTAAAAIQTLDEYTSSLGR